MKNLIKIEILETRKPVPLTRLYILDTSVENFEQHDYDYHGSIDKAIIAKHLFDNMEVENLYDTVYIKAADGLDKNEKVEVFNQSYIKHTGADSPAFVSPDIPRGMHVKDILWLSKGAIGYISIESAFEYFQKSVIYSHETINLGDLFDEVYMQDAENYIFTSSDGHEIKVNKNDISEGILFFAEDGGVSLRFLNLPENVFSVRNLLSIKAVGKQGTGSN